MPTIDKKIVDEIIKNKGMYEDDPPVNFVTEYDNAFGSGKSYGISYKKVNEYTESIYVRNPKVIFERIK